MKNIVVNKKLDIKGKSPFKILKFIGFGIIILILLIAFGGVIKILWNALMPEIFGLKEISYFQGVGLLLLSRILIGGFGSDKSSNDNRQGLKNYKVGPVSVKVGPPVEEEKTNSEDDSYEEWWAEEGESSFEAYNEKKSDNMESTDLD